MTLLAVNLGLPKSGTTTLAKALRSAGLKVADHKIRPYQSKELKGQFVAELLYRGYFETGDPGAHLGAFDGLSEINMMRGPKSLWPQTDFSLLESIRSNHPGVKFIASRRDSADLSNSMLAWTNLGTKRLPNGFVPGLPPGFGGTHDERMRWIDGHYDALEHYFRQDSDFLSYDIKDDTAPRQIGAHIGKEITWWGKANTNPERELT
jgi:hypothetical protein